MKVKIKKLTPGAVIPRCAHGTDYGFDVVATSCEELQPNVYRYGLGFALQPEPEDSGRKVCVTLRPRSSVWKTGMVLSNSIGTIDAGYRGEICAVFYHVMPNLPKYNVGDRIGQIHLSLTEPMDFELTEELSETCRGTGGYGSTGK